MDNVATDILIDAYQKLDFISEIICIQSYPGNWDPF